jgi:hypothetical protein
VWLFVLYPRAYSPHLNQHLDTLPLPVPNAVFGERGFCRRLCEKAVERLKGWALVLSDEAARRRAVEKARRVELCKHL